MTFVKLPNADKNSTSGRFCQIVDVSPKLALEWMKFNRANRRVRQSKIDDYATTMAAGNWHLITQGIAFSRPHVDKEGEAPSVRLIDGQHRLLAIIQSGATVRLTVWFNCEPDEFTYLDQNIIRTNGDIRGLAYADCKHPKLIATIIAQVRRFVFGDKGGGGYWRDEVVYEAFKSEIHAVVDFKRRLGLKLPAQLLSAVFISQAVDPVKTPILVQRLQSMVGFTSRDPMRALRHFIDGKDFRKYSNSAQCYRAIHAFLYSIDGIEISRLRGNIAFLGDARRRLQQRVVCVYRKLNNGKEPDTSFFHPKSIVIKNRKHSEFLYEDFDE